MKLSTMRLPTGEFILVASEARKTDSLRDTMVNLKEATGAAAFFATDDVVEVDDAIIDADAVRRDNLTPYQRAEKLAAESPVTSFYFPNLQLDSIGTLLPGEQTISFSATAHPSVGPEDIAVTRAVMEGREVSPAGLVKGQPGDETFTEEELAGEPTPEAYFPTEGDIVGDEDEPLGHEVDEDEDSYDEPIGLPEPRPIRVGDKVIVTGSTWLGAFVRDWPCTVIEDHSRNLRESTQRDGFTVYVKEDEGNRRMYFRPESVRHAEED